MTDDWTNKVVLVSGASGVLGSAVVHELARSAARLLLTGRSADALQRLAAENSLPPERMAVVPADLADEEQVRHLVDGAMARWGRLDVLLNTVGGWSGGAPVHETALADWQQALERNLQTAFLLSRAVLPPMLQRGWGRIVHVASKAAVDVRPRQAGYTVAKAGLIALTEAIAAEVKGSGVTANVLLPSIIDSPANRAAMPKADPGKWVKPDEIAALMCFLCSDEAAAINGARIAAYGAV